ncbi:MAG: endolytic transglycosylase MltG [Balneolaceae bacterium]|nr:endolytic transglycosylase MltG [Balneolaceae bacterium]MCH8548352.1 endolytic transglycosylase MltG [Balneolaceae bacterium]
MNVISPFSLKEGAALLLLFLLVGLSVWGHREYRLYGDNSLHTELAVELYLHERTGLDELAVKLDSLGVEVDADELIWAGRVLGWRFFRPGLYVLEGGNSYEDFLSKMARGIQDAARVTVHSGTDKDRLARSLSNQLRADSTSFREIFTDSSDVAIELGLTGEELFARMLPNTYEIYWTSSPENVIRRVHNEFSRTIAGRYADQIENSRYNLGEIVTLASIVEWEARMSDEKPKIAGLYLNRLNRNMLLQADPTVIYAIGERRRLLFEDYRVEHPYNTYIHAGIPPGPITNPDEQSIRAVLMPEEHDYLFMVATPEGSHHFSRTFDEHRQASAEWRRWIQEQYRIRAERELLESQSSDSD